MAIDLGPADFIGIGDPLDITGRGAASGALETATTNAELLREFSNITQQNLQPFLDVSNRQLPGLESSATPGGFFADAEALRPLVNELGAPIVADRTRDLQSRLGASGQTRSGFAALEAADIQEDVDLSLLLQLQQMLQGRRAQVAGFGAQTGTNLSRLGLSSAEQLGQVQSQGILAGAQATAAGTQNVVNLAGLGSQFFGNSSGAPINQSVANNPNTLGTITPL